MKRQDHRRINIYIAALLLLLTSCSGLHKIPEGEKLYTGAAIKLHSAEKLKKKKNVEKAAESAVRPRPNKKFLGMRPKLWLYLVAGETKKKGFRSWLKKMGEPPVYFSQVNMGATSKYIDAKLFNIGIFKGMTDPQVQERKKTAHVIYHCYVHPPFKIDLIVFPHEDDYMSELIAGSANESLIKHGADYNLEVLRAETERIDAVLKNNGYFYFSPDYLLFKADTSQSTHTVDLELTVKEDAPYRSLLIYRIADIYVNAGYSATVNNDSIRMRGDTIVVDSIAFNTYRLNIKPKAILRSIFLRPYDIYSRQNHNITLNRLMSMGNFKFVSVRFTESDTANPGFLNADIMLTQMPKRTFRSEVDLVSKSNDFTGPRVTVNYKNRNTLNGAELLNVDLGASFETQLSGKYENLFSYQLSPTVELIVPRFVTPFKVQNKKSLYIPKTKISIGYSYNKRVDYFNLTSLKFSYGYKWKENIKKEHELLPVNINFTRISKPSLRFTELLETNPLLKRSYEEQFIAGMSYTFTFNEQVIENQKSQFYFSGTTELSGNTLSLIHKITTGDNADSSDPERLAGAVYSQFARFTTDVRNYFNFPNKNRIALRFYTGVGIPYGNSSTLPYIKQFFSGGPNSIRAFLINSVGPGTYHADEADGSQLSFLTQGGDIKIEGNAEYRCNLISILKGALFIDAGNTWFIRQREEQQSPPFRFSHFVSELAAGFGAGVRIDASFFVLRFDLATPMRKPWLQEGNRWVLKDIDFSSRTWRRENLILNIAIGYPF
jgi:outer membrane protein insertion porin family